MMEKDNFCSSAPPSQGLLESVNCDEELCYLLCECRTYHPKKWKQKQKRNNRAKFRIPCHRVLMLAFNFGYLSHSFSLCRLRTLSLYLLSIRNRSGVTLTWRFKSWPIERVPSIVSSDVNGEIVSEARCKKSGIPVQKSDQERSRVAFEKNIIVIIYMIHLTP